MGSGSRFESNWFAFTLGAVSIGLLLINLFYPRWLYVSSWIRETNELLMAEWPPRAKVSPSSGMGLASDSRQDHSKSR